MVRKNSTNVSDAFDLLKQAMQDEIAFLNEEGARAFKKSDYNGVQEAREQVAHIVTLQEKVEQLSNEWKNLARERVSIEKRIPSQNTQTKRQNFGRAQRGESTPEHDYYIPILKTLNQMGGSGEPEDILEEVEQMMIQRLRKADYEKNTSGSIRWHKRANWARKSMVDKGLLKANSPRGVWEISEAGRDYIREHDIR